MADLRFFIDAQQIAAEFKELKDEVEKAVADGVKQLASMTYAKTQELASSKLHSTRKTYLDNLSFKEEAPGIWVVSLDEKALFIEDGRKSGDMTADLLKSGYKTAKDGSRYKAIPFDHGKTPSETPRSAENYVKLLKHELRSRNIPYKKLELDASGSPRLGKLHTLNIESMKPSRNASHDIFSGLSIYQTKTSSGKVRRDIMTFRVVSSKHKGSKWIHPGLDAKKFMDEAFEWATGIFDKEILPGILERFGK